MDEPERIVSVDATGTGQLVTHQTHQRGVLNTLNLTMRSDLMTNVGWLASFVVGTSVMSFNPCGSQDTDDRYLVQEATGYYSGSLQDKNGTPRCKFRVLSPAVELPNRGTVHAGNCLLAVKCIFEPQAGVLEKVKTDFASLSHARFVVAYAASKVEAERYASLFVKWTRSYILTKYNIEVCQRADGVTPFSSLNVWDLESIREVVAAIEFINRTCPWTKKFPRDGINVINLVLDEESAENRRMLEYVKRVLSKLEDSEPSPAPSSAIGSNLESFIGASNEGAAEVFGKETEHCAEIVSIQDIASDTDNIENESDLSDNSGVAGVSSFAQSLINGKGVLRPVDKRCLEEGPSATSSSATIAEVLLRHMKGRRVHVCPDSDLEDASLEETDEIPSDAWMCGCIDD